MAKIHIPADPERLAHEERLQRFTNLSKKEEHDLQDIARLLLDFFGELQDIRKKLDIT